MDTSTTKCVAAAWAVPGYLYEVELGVGASGRVARARHQATGRAVAIKYLAEQLHADSDFRAFFRSEARVLAELQSPHVVQLYEYVEDAAGAAIVMELVEGVPLRAVLDELGAVGPEAALVVLKGSLLGLAAAHASGIVHRDYKPENVLVTADGVSTLVDFGIAVKAGSTAKAAGTPPYMAPEQWQGAAATPATDVYAATATFFECLTGTRPYSGASTVELGLQHLQAPIPDALAPEPVRSLIRSGLAKTPAERQMHAAALLAELEAVAAAGYGERWEERGQRKLATLAALLPLLFPSAATSASAGTALATTSVADHPVPDPVGESTEGVLPSGRPAVPGRRSRILAGAATAAVVVGIVVVQFQPGGHHRGNPTARGGGVATMPAASLAGPSAVASHGRGEASPRTSAPTAAPTPSSPPGVSPGSTAASGKAAAPFLDASTGSSLGATTAPSPTPSATLRVDSVTITRFTCGGRQGSVAITLQTDGTADGAVTLTWFHADAPGPTGSTVEATQTFALPRGQSEVSIPASHFFDGGAWWGVSVSTSPQAARGNASYQVRDAFVCNPPR
ncbi:protein kinase [Streptomyces sp. NPDC002659]|uniref:serine/threonine-protein kinase n=1 Tax=Streptomyces sp. NPDC002659 TaxID=3364656 RepID=UPI0036A2D5FC